MFNQTRRLRPKFECFCVCLVKCSYFSETITVVYMVYKMIVIKPTSELRRLVVLVCCAMLCIVVLSCSDVVHCLSIVCSLFVRCLFTVCSLVHCSYTVVSLLAHCLFTVSTLRVHFSQFEHCWSTFCSLVFAHSCIVRVKSRAGVGPLTICRQVVSKVPPGLGHIMQGRGVGLGSRFATCGAHVDLAIQGGRRR